jgi:polar amino acid transport system permease protein
MQFDWQFFWKALFTPSEPFLHGLVLTIVISVVAMSRATIVGVVIALMRRSRFGALRWAAGVYIWVIRGTPLLVQLVIIYTGLAAVGLYQFHDVSLVGMSVKAAVQAAIIGLMINESAYIAEIVRAGLDSVPKGQFEAAAAIGMKPGKVMRWIIMPQALRVMVPPLGNSFNGMMKTTSVLSVIGVSEMFLVTQSISSYTFHTFEIFIVAAIYYLALTTIWTFIQAYIESRLARQIGIEQRIPITQRLLGTRRAALALQTSPVASLAPAQGMTKP